jgi:hypothetical protein
MFALAQFAAAGALTLKSGKLGLAIDAATLAYTVSVDGVDWLVSDGGATAGYAFSADNSTFSRANGGLVAVGSPTTGTGSDGIGRFDSVALLWARNATASKAEWRTTVRAYAGRSGAFVFEQARPAR